MALRMSAVINSEDAFTRYCLSDNSSVTHQASAVSGFLNQLLFDKNRDVLYL